MVYIQNPHLQPRSRIPTRATALPTKRQLTNLIMLIQRTLLLSHLRRGNGVARRHVHAGVVCEEISRPQQERHGLDGHDGEVLGRGDVCHAKGVPEHDVGVFRLGCAVGDPFGETLGGLA